MFDPANRDTTPQFGTAEYGSTPTEERCHFCQQALPQQYYRVGGATACGTCAEIAKRQAPENANSAFGKSLLFGIGAAILGMAGYATLVIILRGWTIGYISVGVGYLVGKAMMFGSGGLGGRRFQIAAAVLTYMAVSVAEVPIEIALARHAPTKQEQAQEEQKQLEKEFGQQPSTPPPQTRPHRKLGIGGLIVVYFLVGLASPFLQLQNPIYGLLGLVILFVGIQIAWKMTAGRRPLEVFGPFDSAKPA